MRPIIFLIGVGVLAGCASNEARHQDVYQVSETRIAGRSVDAIVISVRAVVIADDSARYAGGATGAALGGLLGSKTSKNGTKSTVGGILGGVAGGVLGAELASGAKEAQGQEIIVESLKTHAQGVIVQRVLPDCCLPGQAVRVVEGAGGARVIAR